MGSMKPTEHFSALIDRLDDVQMNAADRERAKVMMRQAEGFAEIVADIHEHVCAAAGAITGTFSSFPERIRSALSHAVHR